MFNIAAKFVGSKPIYISKFQRKAERQQQLAMQYLTLRQQTQMQSFGMPFPPYVNAMMAMGQFPYRQGRMGAMPAQRFPAPGGFQRPPSVGGPQPFAGGVRPRLQVRPLEVLATCSAIRNCRFSGRISEFSIFLLLMYLGTTLCTAQPGCATRACRPRPAAPCRA